jgi:mono/diheme cytochrome c family protein
MRAPAFIVCGALTLLVAGSASGQDAAKFFDDNCAMCHAIGGPPGDAPDLKDITKRRDRAWLLRFILDPEAAAKVDADAAALVKHFDNVMPSTDGATPEIIEALLRYIDAQSPAPSVAPVPAVRTVTASDIATGRDLYEARRPLAQRGPSCVSCHRLESVGGWGGGTLGPDLTRTSQRLGGARSVSTWLANPPTRVMRAVFRKQPLAGDEAFAIAAMLDDASRQSAGAAQSRTLPFVATGAAAALLALMAMALIWAQRLRSVRRPLVDAVRRRPGNVR